MLNLKLTLILMEPYLYACKACRLKLRKDGKVIPVVGKNRNMVNMICLVPKT